MIIKKIKHEQKVGKSGKPFESCQILTVNSQGQDTWISGFGSEITHSWKEGSKIDVNVKQNQAGYWNFEPNENTKALPSQELELLQEISRKLDLILKSGSLYQKATENAYGGQLGGFTVNTADTDEIRIEDIPF